MRSTYLWAAGIAVLLLAWLASGQLNQEPVVFDPSIAERNEQDLNQLNDQTPTRVRVVQSQAQLKTRYASVRGKTQNKRHAAWERSRGPEGPDGSSQKGLPKMPQTIICLLFTLSLKLDSFGIKTSVLVLKSSLKKVISKYP